MLGLPTSDYPGALCPWKGQCHGGIVGGTNPGQHQPPHCCSSRECPTYEPQWSHSMQDAGSSFPASLSSSLRWMDGLTLRSIPADSGTPAPALTDQPLHRCRGSAVNRLRQSQASPRNTRVQMLALPSEEGVIDGVSAEIQAPWVFAQGRLGWRCRRGIFSHLIHSYLSLINFFSPLVNPSHILPQWMDVCWELGVLGGTEAKCGHWVHFRKLNLIVFSTE